MNIFEEASRAQLRFDTPVGLLTTEDLWDLKLTGQVSLESIAQGLHEELNKKTTFFINESKDPGSETRMTTLKFNIVKHIIDTRLAQIDAASAAADKRQKKAQLLEALERKQDADLESKTTEELMEMLDAL